MTITDEIPNYATIIIRFSAEIKLIIKSYITDGYQAMSAALAKPIASLCVLFIVLTGFAIMRGLIKKPMDEFSKVVLRIGVVYLLAMNWAFFSVYFVDFFTKGASELGDVMMQATPFTIPHLSIGGVEGGLQSVLIEVVRVGTWVWDRASITHFGPAFTAIMIYASGIAVVGLAFFEIIVAKLMIAICLTTAPLFFAFTLFDKTRPYFDKWVDKLVGFSLVLVFVSTVVGLCMHFIHWTIGAHFLNHAINLTAVDWVPIFLVACFCVMAIFEVVGIAKSIGGMCSSGTGSAMVGGALGGALGMASRSGPMTKAGLGLAAKFTPGGVAAAGELALTKMASSGGSALKRGSEAMSSIRQGIRGGE